MKHDCRNINGKSCRYLKPLGERIMKTNYRSYLCLDLNVILWPDFLNEFKPNEKIIGIAPEFNCKEMGKLRKQGKADQMAFSLDKDGSKHWNEKVYVDF